MKAFNEHLRLSILRLLSGAPKWTADSSVLHAEANRFGLAATSDQIKNELAWLDEQGAVVVANTSLRLGLLRLLAEAQGRRANSSILHAEAQRTGLPCSRAQVKAELRHLGREGAVANEELLDIVVSSLTEYGYEIAVGNEHLGDLVVATLTERGLDVANGIAIMPGVQRPTPRS